MKVRGAQVHFPLGVTFFKFSCDSVEFTESMEFKEKNGKNSNDSSHSLNFCSIKRKHK